MRYAPSQHLLATVLLSSLLAACGGGGGGEDEPAPASAEGAYVGTLSGSPGIDRFNAVVLENGEMWAFYGQTMSSGVFGISGFLQGPGSSNNGNYASTDTRDFGVSPAITAKTTATYNTRLKTINGRFEFGSDWVLFNGDGNTAPYDYHARANLAAVTGNWSLSALTGETVAMSVTSNGAITATTNTGCTLTGTLAPRPSGKNVFDASLRFGPAPCALPNQSATGIAIAYPLGNGSQQFMFGGFDASRQHGTAVVGTR